MSPAPRLVAGAEHVPTPDFLLAQHVAERACELGEIAGFFGDPGLGKTHALQHFIDHCELDTAWITASPSPGRKEIFEELLIELTGGCDYNASARQLRRDCIDLLAERKLAVVLDEAQHLSFLWLQQLRSLHDHRDARWALLLVGGVGCARKLKRSPELWSRVGLRVDFQPLTGDLLLSSLSAYHPVLASTPPELLTQIDERFCRGNFRRWHQVLEHAQALLAASSTPDRLSPKVVRAVFSTLGAR